tara:strand:+ start:70 stop:405 length:336 start_codon:yes stop_codon:yes gene_type:complete
MHVVEMGMEEIDDTVMTNFDGTIDRKVEAQLRERPYEVFSEYAGLAFCGYVWFDGAKFKCEVLGKPVMMLSRRPGVRDVVRDGVAVFRQKVFSAEDLETIMEEVSSEFGWE